LLNAENNTGIKLTESFAMHPGASVSGLYFSHPDSKYFGVGQIGRDQAIDYATRRSEAVSEVEKRLAPNLGKTARLGTGRAHACCDGRLRRSPFSLASLAPCARRVRDEGVANCTRGACAPQMRENKIRVTIRLQFGA